MVADQAGGHSCTFTASVNRDCAPSDLILDGTGSTIGPDLQFAGLPDADEVDPGGVLFVNNDDDNGNGTPDMAPEEDPGPTAGEDDLVGLALSVSGATEGTVELSGGGGNVNIYRNPDRSNAVVLPAQWPLSDMPATLHVEGVEASEPRDVALILTYENGTVSCEDVVKLTVVQVESLAWEQADPGNAALDDCTNNGGKRIFPGKTGPQSDQPALRRNVKLVATLAPSGLDIPVTVHFRVWDVDDPFDQLHGPNGPPADLIADVNLIDNNMAGVDNRGDNDPGPGVYAANTNAEEPDKAIVTLTVAMQLGDNYRAGASCLSDAVSTEQVSQTDADLLGVKTDPNGWFVPNGNFNEYRVPVTWSPMLTVWRKLWVEVESMASEPNTVAGRSPDWDSIRIDGAALNVYEGTTMLDVTSLTTLGGGLASGEANHYKGGGVTVQGFTGSLFIVRNTSSSLEIDRTLSDAEIALLIAATGTLRDDDPIAGVLPTYPPMSTFVQNAYSAAYISFESLDVVYNPNRIVPFDLNLTDLEVATGAGWDNWQDVFSSNGFWAALLVAAYQPGSSGDQDSDAFLGDNDNQWGTNYGPDPYLYPGVTVEDSDNASLVFIEFIRDVGTQAGKDLDHTIAHEIGHSAGNDTSAAQDHAEGGIMEDGAPDDQDAFSAHTLVRFRESTKW